MLNRTKNKLLMGCLVPRKRIEDTLKVPYIGKLAPRSLHNTNQPEIIIKGSPINLRDKSQRGKIRNKGGFQCQSKNGRK